MPPPPNNTIVATMLSGNNEAIVAEAIRSVIDWVDLFLLIDTGIHDETPRIAKELAGSKLRHARFEWCQDFAKARNFALQSAAALGATWALTIDTDERLLVEGYHTIADLKHALHADSRVISWMVSARDGSYAKERFIRMPTHLEWRGRTHEALVGATAVQRKTLAGIRFFEETKTPEQFRSKLKRDLIVLRQETRDQSDNARWWFYLGQTLEQLGDYGEATVAYRRCLDIRKGWAEQAAWAAFRAANCFIKLDEFERAIELCASGLSRQAASPELAWLAGYCSYRLGNFVNAAAWEEMAIAIGCVEGTSAAEKRVGFRDLSGWYEGPYDVLRFVYRKIGQPRKADACEQKYHEALEARAKIAATPRSASSAGSPQSRTDSSDKVRVAVLGLYSSGSSAVAGILHHLGIVMGRDLWQDHFEARWLAEQLRSWWQEPFLTERTPRTERVRVLQRWMEDMERDAPSSVGAKHPLLTLCADDLREAWGEQTKFIWSYRPQDESIASLRRRKWWPDREEAIQQRLWSAASEFFATHNHVKVVFDDLFADPRKQMQRIVEFLELSPTEEQIAAASASIRKRT